MPKHPARLKNVGISQARYEELKAVCRQYRECRRRLELARAGIVDRSEGRGAWRRPDPTGNAALALADHPDARRVALIEQCAQAVAEPVTAAAILKSVTEGQPWSRLRPPCGEKQFYVLRLLFYIELDRRL